MYRILFVKAISIGSSNVRMLVSCLIGRFCARGEIVRADHEVPSTLTSDVRSIFFAEMFSLTLSQQSLRFFSQLHGLPEQCVTSQIEIRHDVGSLYSGENESMSKYLDINTRSSLIQTFGRNLDAATWSPPRQCIKRPDHEKETRWRNVIRAHDVDKREYTKSHQYKEKALRRNSTTLPTKPRPQPSFPHRGGAPLLRS